MKPSQLIARYIRGQLAMSGFTQQEAADAVGMVQQALSRRLTGQTPFTIDELTALVRYLGIDYAEMIDGVQVQHVIPGQNPDNAKRPLPIRR